MDHPVKRDINVTNIYLLLLEEEMILMKTKKVVVLFGLLSS